MVYIPGPIADFNRFPQVGPGSTGPLLFNPPALIQTPEIMRMGVGRLVTYRQWGFPVGNIPPAVAHKALRDWANGPTQAWGIGRSTAQLDDFDQYQAPAASSEVIREFDRLRCVEANTRPVEQGGVAFELTRFDIPSAAVGVLERIPTTLEVEALDAQGVPIFTYGDLNGERPCRSQLVHPDPAVVTPLTWRWRITVTHNSAIENVVEPFLVVLPSQVPGDDIVEPWRDLRNGSRSMWGDRRQVVIHPRMTVRYWVELFGPESRFRITVGGRLSGYWQIAGRRGTALQGATQRIV